MSLIVGYEFKSIYIGISKEAGELPDDWYRSHGEKSFLEMKVSDMA